MHAMAMQPNVCFRKGYEKDDLVRHVTLKALPTTGELLSCLGALESMELPFGSLVIQRQSELLNIPKWSGIATASPEIKKWAQTGLVVPRKALAKVVRGIATGANEFFALPIFTASLSQPNRWGKHAQGRATRVG